MATMSATFVPRDALEFIPGTTDQNRARDPAESASEALEDAIEGVPALLGRLLLVAGFLDHKNQTYRVPFLKQHCDQRRIDQLLRQKHRELLLSWLGLSLAYRIADMTACLRGSGKAGGGVRARLQSKSELLRLLPPGIEGMYRDHFIQEVTLTLPIARARV